MHSKTLDLEKLVAEIHRLEHLTMKELPKRGDVALAYVDEIPNPSYKDDHEVYSQRMKERGERWKGYHAIRKEWNAADIRLTQLYCLRANHRGKRHMTTLWKSHNTYGSDILDAHCRPSEDNPRPKFTLEDEEKFIAPVKKEFWLGPVGQPCTVNELGDAFYRGNPIDIPAVNWKDIKREYHTGFYDGMQSGVVRYQGNRYYATSVFEGGCIDPTNGGDREHHRVFAFFHLTPEEWAMEDKNHKLFQRYVGTHTDYDEDDKRSVGKVKPRIFHGFYYNSKFVKQMRMNKDYTDKQVLFVSHW